MSAPLNGYISPHAIGYAIVYRSPGGDTRPVLDQSYAPQYVGRPDDAIDYAKLFDQGRAIPYRMLPLFTDRVAYWPGAVLPPLSPSPMTPNTTH